MTKSPAIYAAPLLALVAVGSMAGGYYTARAAETMIQPTQIRTSQIEGSTVYDRQNEDVATVKDLIVDKAGKIDDVVLTVGTTAGMGGKYVAIPYASLKFDNNRLTVDQTKEQLNAEPAYTLKDTNTGAGEGAVPPVGGHATSNGTH